MNDLRYRCGHVSHVNPWKPTPCQEQSTKLCSSCKYKRIGQNIEFLRFGEPPSSGRSWDHRDQEPLKGVSVYELRDGVPVFDGWYFGFLSRPAFRGVGEVVGVGSDGEPVVKINSIEKWVGPKTW